MNRLYEITHAIQALNNRYKAPEKIDRNWRSPSRQWDRIICRICTGCGKRLGRYENRKNLAFCYNCREILFPESVTPKEAWRKRRFQGWA